jgi:hypothetical protein
LGIVIGGIGDEERGGDRELEGAPEGVEGLGEGEREREPKIDEDEEEVKSFIFFFLIASLILMLALALVIGTGVGIGVCAGVMKGSFKDPCLDMVMRRRGCLSVSSLVARLRSTSHLERNRALQTVLSLAKACHVLDTERHARRVVSLS